MFLCKIPSIIDELWVQMNLPARNRLLKSFSSRCKKKLRLSTVYSQSIMVTEL